MTSDIPYSKLVNLTVHSDGLQFHLSNRVNAPLFKINRQTDVLAAVVNAAAQRAEARALTPICGSGGVEGRWSNGESWRPGRGQSGEDCDEPAWRPNAR
jgi:hypothetical protein